MSEIRKWLVGIGLDQYADAFQANDIDMDLLKQVDDAEGYRYRERWSSTAHSQFHSQDGLSC